MPRAAGRRGGLDLDLDRGKKVPLFSAASRERAGRQHDSERPEARITSGPEGWFVD